MSSRTDSHRIENKAEDIFKSLTGNLNRNDKELLYRNLSGRDYGVDGLLEIFYRGDTTGLSAYVQLKGTTQIKKVDDNNFVSCAVNNTTFKYCSQNRIPVVLINVNVNQPGCFYYLILQYDHTFESKLNQGTISIRIPIENCVFNNQNTMDELESFYDYIMIFFNME